MAVFCVKDERGWLFKEQPVPPVSGALGDDEDALALAVYTDAEDALADTDPEGSGSVVQMRSPEVITEALEAGRLKYVRVRLDDEEDSVCALPGWRYMVERGLFD
jgi:hypothetical protein